MIVIRSSLFAEESLENIEYIRHEYHGKPEECTANLATFVYDVPYFGACGIFPPFHIINQIFSRGGSEGGMSPGATWKPFQITEKEYDELVSEIKVLSPQELGDSARYNFFPFEFDSRFDHISKWEEWIFSVCDVHRESFHHKINSQINNF